MADNPTSTDVTTNGRSKRHIVRNTVLLAASVVAGANLMIAAPVGAHLAHDDRNQGIKLAGYRSFGVHPTEITLDLWAVRDGKAPIDVLRTLFQAADALKGRHFSRVILARSGKPVFAMSGDDFQEIGQAYASDENPMFLIRTLPEKLTLLDGSPAFEAWEGGWLGVLSAQMKDVNVMSRTWMTGTPQPDL